MKRMLPITVAAIALAASTGTASAASPKRILATPAQACKTMVAYDAGGYAGYGDCMGRLNKDVAAYRFPADDGSGLLSLDQRCAQFEQGITDPESGEVLRVTYPFFFTEGGPQAGWPFPEFTAQNHRQCEITLFTYHTLAGG